MDYSIKSVLTIFVLSFSLMGVSQEEESVRNKYILTKNSFSIGIANGFNKTQFTSTDGDDIPKSGLGWVPKFNLDYRFSLGERFGINLGAGVGFSPFSYKVHAKDPFQGTAGWSYLQLAQYHPYASIKTSLDFNYWFADKWGFTSNAGVGFWSIDQLQNSIGGESSSGLEYLFVLDYKEDLNPFVYLTTGVNRILKNDNLLNLSLSYEYAFNDVYTGVYVLYNGQSYGGFINNGSNVGLSLAYVLTRAKKFKEIDDFYIETGDIGSIEDVKKETKIAKRHIDESTMFFGLAGGAYFARNETGFGEHFVEAGGTGSWIISAEMEKGMNGNQFMQFGLDISETYNYIKIATPGLSFYNGSNEFIGVQFSAGIGTRLISEKSKINFLNLSAGLSIGVHGSSQGPSGYAGTYYPTADGMDTLYKYRIDYETKSNIYPTIYLNLSRDFQLTKAFYLSFDYRFNYGFVTAVRGEVTYQEQPNFDVVRTDRINIKGTANAFQLGLKYKFVPKKNQE